jgi:hypothetical protein
MEFVLLCNAEKCHTNRRDDHLGGRDRAHTDTGMSTASRLRPVMDYRPNRA